MGAWERGPQSLSNFCNFSEKNSHLDDVLHVLEQLEKAKLVRWGLGGEAPRQWAILAISQKKKPFKQHLDDVLNVFRATRKS